MIDTRSIRLTGRIQRGFALTGLDVFLGIVHRALPYAIADGLSALTGEARSAEARPSFAGGGRVGVRAPLGSGVLASLCPCVMTEGRKDTRTQGQDIRTGGRCDALPDFRTLELSNVRTSL